MLQSRPGRSTGSYEMPGNTINPDEKHPNQHGPNMTQNPTNVTQNAQSSSSSCPMAPPVSSTSIESRSNRSLLSERVQSSISSCSVVATAGTPSSPRSIKSGISSVSPHGITVPLSHASSGPVIGMSGASSSGLMYSVGSGALTNPDLSIQYSLPYGGFYSPPGRPLSFIKRPSSALSDGSIHTSTAVLVGDSLPRDDELTTIDDEELHSGDDGGSSGDGQLDIGGSCDDVQLNIEQQSNTPTHLIRAAKGGDGSSVMGGRKAFESSNYADNLDELGSFTVKVTGADLRFSCAHFVAYDGYRERLHGHSYQVSMVVGGKLNPDGYVVDFNLCKRIVRETCNKFNEYMIIPMKSDVLSIKTDDGSIHVVTQSGAQFMFPESDCLCLPIMHSTAEELAAHFWNVALQAFTPQYLQKRGVTWLEISVAERPTQEAQYRRHIPVPPQF